MDINKAQEEVDKWINNTGVRYFNELTNMALLVEEIGEMARIIARKYGEQSYKKGEENLDLEEEMGDVFFVLICLANQTGIDLSSALNKSFYKKNLRDQNRHLNNPKLK
jgi:NTP pyrophosphatase (non-canonical NTP hydrolase)